MESTIRSFEYVDRDYNKNIIQCGMFKKITDPTQIKVGDRFICPRTETNLSGILCSNSMKPILLFKSAELKSTEWHITYQQFKDKVGKAGAAVAWDLCYLLIEE